MMILQAPDIRQNLPFFLDHFSQMSKDDIYCRFLHTVSPDSIRTWLLSYDTESSFHTWFIVEKENDGTFSGIAQISYESVDRSKAEIAISVLEPYRGRGLALALINEAVRLLKLDKTKEANFNCHIENHSCRSVFRKAGFIGAFDHDQDVFIGKLNLE